MNPGAWIGRSRAPDMKVRWGR